LSNSALSPVFSRIVATPAKVNLGLKIVGRRPDGYHDIFTVMEPISLADTLYCEFRPAADAGFEIDCPQLPDVAAGENLVVKAARLMVSRARERGGLRSGRWFFFLDKKIPSGAGLGGGSSNAAAVIRILDEFYGLALEPSEKRDIALELGADVPFFLNPVLALAEGVGERLTPLGASQPRYYLLVKPPLAIDTGWAYGALSGVCREKIPAFAVDQFAGPVAEYRLENDFEAPVMARYPWLGELKSWLARCPGAQAALMSGSGSVFYAVFSRFDQARAAERAARRRWREAGCEFYLARNLVARFTPGGSWK